MRSVDDGRIAHRGLVLCLLTTLALGLAACGGGGGGGGGTGGDGGDAGGGGGGGDTGGGGGGGAAPDVTISGKVQFERVPHTGTGPLDYNAVFDVPVRQAVVQAVSSTGSVLETARTDDAGDYSLVVPGETQLFIRVRAEIVDSGGRWDFKVVDNTSNGALYVLDGAVASSGDADSVRDLTAQTGWNGFSYASARAAGPFAILDSVNEARLAVLAVDPDVSFEALTLNWSPDNRPVSGSRANGEIGTTFYSANEIFVLGAENNDTDEYDGHVVVHEFGHFFEDTLSRADSVGGPHTTADILDPRVAFSEGFGYAWAGIVLGDAVTQDSFGNDQSLGFIIDVDANVNANPGWYSEGSAQSILFDLFDADDDGVDNIALGFQPLYDVLVNTQRTSDAFTTVFSYVDALKTARPADAAAIDAVVAAQDIVSATIEPFASTETNDAGNADVLPVYTEITVGGPARTVCSIDTFGDFNKLSNRRFLWFDVAASGRYEVTVTGPNGSDPDIVLWQRGFVAISQLETNGQETLTTPVLAPGRYLLEVYEGSFVFTNLAGGVPSGRACLDVSVATS